MKLPFHNWIIVLLLAGTAGCKQDADLATPEPEFYVKAQKNGVTWQASGSGVYVRSAGRLYVFGLENMPDGRQGYLRLGFAPPPDLSAATVRASEVEWSLLVGGDVLVDSYSPADPTNLASIEITQLDTVQKIVAGRFRTLLRRDKRWSSQAEPLEFANGSFRVRYQPGQ
jgi:hypothetical protein